MSKKAACKHCGFSWTKGTDSGHSKDECIERLKAELGRMAFVKDSLIKQLYNLTTEQGGERMSEIKIKSPEGFGLSRFEWFLCSIIIPFTFFIAFLIRLFVSEEKAIFLLKSADIIN